MLDIAIVLAIIVFAIFLLFVGTALESKLKAEAAYDRAQALKAQSDAAYTRFQREQGRRHLGRGGLPESMSPSFPAM